MKYFFFLVTFSAFFYSCKTNTNKSNYEKTPLGAKVTLDSTIVQIEFYSPSIVRVSKSSKKDISSIEKSLSVILEPKAISFELDDENEKFIRLSTSQMNVLVDTQTGSITYTSKEGDNLLKEKSGSTAFIPFKDVSDNTYSVSQTYELAPKEEIYGLGSLQNGKMSQRNQELKMIQDNTWDYIPFFQSSKGYGLFWDNYSPTTFIDNDSGTTFKSEVGPKIDYYFMYGGTSDAVVGNMRNLTGEVPMFPLWTYGFWQSKERYKSQEETVGVVKKYRELGVPLDGIIQDWQYWGDNYHWNAMQFLNDKFPNPQKMVDQIHELNAHMVISIWSSFGPETQQYKELNKNNMLFDFKTWPLSGKDVWPPDMDYPSGVRVYDAYNPKARDIYWKYLKKGLFTLDIDGWWMDSTEPDHLDFKPKDLDNKTYLGSFRKVRNAYPLMTVGGVYKHQRQETSSKRVFILTRSAFAGQQRYGANTWSGDVTASWEALANQIPSGLNFSLTGIPYWNSDIGGFFLSNFKNKLEDPEYRELYVRWLQFGGFTPMMRSHGTDAPREIYQFGQKGDIAYDAIEKSIHLRYSLLPYIYASAWQVTHNQSSMMRALVMDFSNDEKVLDLNNEYMFGKSILVAPVTEAMYSKDKTENFDLVKSKEVYLPKGSSWFDFWTEEQHEGGSTVAKETPIDIIPLYIRSGSIIPFGPTVQYATEKSWKNLNVKIYSGADGEFTLYEDEFDNYNYEDGAYSQIQFIWDDAKNELTIMPVKGNFKGMHKERMFDFKLIGEKPFSKSVKYQGEKLVISFKE